jgi:hypothetical protein
MAVSDGKFYIEAEMTMLLWDRIDWGQTGIGAASTCFQ